MVTFVDYNNIIQDQPHNSDGFAPLELGCSVLAPGTQDRATEILEGRIRPGKTHHKCGDFGASSPFVS